MENLKALVFGKQLTAYQRALVQREFKDMVERLELLENAVKNNAVLPTVSGSLPVEELRSKLLGMRFTKEEIRSSDNEKALEMYGFTDCINQLLEWLQPKRQ